MTDLSWPKVGLFFFKKKAFSESISAADTNIGVFSQKQEKDCNGQECASLLKQSCLWQLNLLLCFNPSRETGMLE